jgi:hypothetical protein
VESEILLVYLLGRDIMSVVKEALMRNVDRTQVAAPGEGVQAEKTLAALAAVAEALGKLRFGAVHLTVHEGRVVQLDVTERQRFT